MRDSGLHNIKKILESVWRKATKLVKEALHGKRQRTLGLLILEKRKLTGDPIALYNFLRKSNVEEGTCLYCLVTSERIQRNSTKLHQGRFRLDIR